MSKVIKQMQMDSLKQTFGDVRDMVLVSAGKFSCAATHQLRSGMRKKSVKVQMVKNSLCRKVFSDLGMKVEGCWAGSTLIIWGGNSLAELSKDIEAVAKKNDQIKVKAAVSEGQLIDFKTALLMPTKPEALGRIVGLALSPATRLASMITAPAATVAGQIKTLAERPEATEEAPVAAPVAS